jgi:hypothetical protein
MRNSLPACLARVVLFALGVPTVGAAANTAPVIFGSPATSLAAGSAYFFQPAVWDADGQRLTYTIANKPSWATFSTATGILSGTPTAAHAGTTWNVVVSTTDGIATASLAPFNITVTSSGGSIGNTAPVIYGTPATTIAAGSAYSFQPAVWDADGQRLTYTIANKPSWASFSTATGILSGTPTASHAGTTANIVVSTTDGIATASLAPFSITVTSSGGSTGNTPPVIHGTPATTVAAGSAYSFQPSVWDADGQRLTYTISGKPSWASFSTVTGILSGTPTAAHAGTTANIVVSTTDGIDTASLAPFSITVTSSGGSTGNTAPVIHGSPATTVAAGSAYSFQPAVWDADGDALGYSISNKPAWATFSIVNGQLSGTPSTAQAGTYGGIVISTSDGKTTASLPAFAISVTGAGTTSGTATLQWQAPVQNTDGTALTDLAGYRLYHGTSATALTDVRVVSSPGITSYVFDQLASGTHWFAITAVNSAGTESARSGTGSKVIP